MAAWVCLAVGLGSASTSHGSVFELFGGGPRSASMAGASVAAANGAEAAFHNPALLADSRYGGVSVGFAYSSFDVGVRLARPICTASYTTCRAAAGGPFSIRAPKLPPSTASLQLGWHAPLAGPLRKRVAVAAQMTLPLRRVLSISGPDPQTPHFYMYEGLPDRFALLLAASVQPAHWVAIGVAAQILAALDSDVDLDLDVNNHVMDRASVEIRLQPVARLVAGLILRPAPGVRIGASYRQEISLRYDIPSTIALGEAATAALLVEQQTLFSPDSWHFGGAWRSRSGAWLLSASVSLAMWSTAPDPSPQVAIDVTGASLDAIGLGEALDVGNESAPIALRMRNTWRPALAAQWLVRPRLKVRAGYAYEQAALPRATGAWSYLQGDGHVLAAGFDFGLQAPIASRPPGRDDAPPQWLHPLYIRVAAQVIAHPRTTVIKADPNDPVGDFEYAGTALHTSVGIGGTW